MLKELLEKSSGPISNSTLKEILDLTTTDIKVNRINYGQRTSLREAVEIAGICYSILQK